MDKAIRIVITLTDILGKKVANYYNQTFEAGSYELPLKTGNIPNGAYILTMTSNGTNYTQQIIINR